MVIPAMFWSNSQYRDQVPNFSHCYQHTIGYFNMNEPGKSAAKKKKKNVFTKLNIFREEITENLSFTT